MHCKRGLVWGELEFVLPDGKVVRLHGTEWSETQRFYHHLHTLWQQWSTEMRRYRRRRAGSSSWRRSSTLAQKASG
ncbi:hypothetical protein LN650_21165 [Klebsiella pneumoniae subsp. pneumoniae]|nr:hypothetical protein [Klebsiella pneumoniae subsp. pneumoniae]